MRKIMKAIKAALQAAMRALGGAWATMFGSDGGDVMIDDLEDTLPVEQKAAETAAEPGRGEHDERVDRRRDAALVRTYSMRAVMTGDRPSLAPCLPRAIKDWLPGLDAGQLKMLADANADQVLQHLHQGPYIQGLHRVQRLRPVALLMKTGPVADGNEPREVSDLRPSFQ